MMLFAHKAFKMLLELETISVYVRITAYTNIALKQ